jgi:sodium-dependent phosphate transporter
MAFGIGANDSANAWATSVGSNAIGIRNACLIGGFAELLGATSLGYGVRNSSVSVLLNSKATTAMFCRYLVRFKMSVELLLILTAGHAAIAIPK